MREGILIDLQRRKYMDAYRFQQKVHQLRKDGVLPDTLILVEHPPVYTVGRDGGLEYFKISREYLLSKGIEVHEIDRGGSVTFHGPGQLVGYPIVNLSVLDRDLHRYLRLLEEVIIQSLKTFSIVAKRFPPYTGVWVGKEKIAAIGVGCKKWVTFHGFAVNVDTDLRYFTLIDPCGIKEYGVTSFSKILQKEVLLPDVKEAITEKFGEIFKIKFRSEDPETILTYFERCSAL